MGEGLYTELTQQGFEVLLDDRQVRPGVKFADAELIGIPYRITVGPRGLSSGLVEMTTRRGLSTAKVSLGEVRERISALVRGDLGSLQ